MTVSELVSILHIIKPLKLSVECLFASKVIFSLYFDKFGKLVYVSYLDICLYVVCIYGCNNVYTLPSCSGISRKRHLNLDKVVDKLVK